MYQYSTSRRGSTALSRVLRGVLLQLKLFKVEQFQNRRGGGKNVTFGMLSLSPKRQFRARESSL